MWFGSLCDERAYLHHEPAFPVEMMVVMAVVRRRVQHEPMKTHR